MRVSVTGCEQNVYVHVRWVYALTKTHYLWKVWLCVWIQTLCPRCMCYLSFLPSDKIICCSLCNLSLIQFAGLDPNWLIEQLHKIQFFLKMFPLWFHIRDQADITSVNHDAFCLMFFCYMLKYYETIKLNVSFQNKFLVAAVMIVALGCFNLTWIIRMQHSRITVIVPS